MGSPWKELYNDYRGILKCDENDDDATIRESFIGLNHYERLRCDRNAGKQKIRAAWGKLCKKFHSDKAGHDKQAYDEILYP